MRKKDIQLENIDLIRKIAWKYQKVSREPYKDLFQEGYLGYVHAKDTYDPNRGAFSTHAWTCVANSIKDYLKAMERKNALLNPIEDLAILNAEIPRTDFFDSLPEESLEIAKMVLSAPKDFVVRSQKEVKEKLVNILSSQGWPLEKIWYGLYQLNRACI